MRSLFYASVKFVDGSEDYVSFYHSGSMDETIAEIQNQLNFSYTVKIGNLVLTASQVRSIRIKDR